MPCGCPQLLELPLHPNSPTAELKAPTIHGACSALLLDARASTGGGVFAMSYAWNISAAADDPAVVAARHPALQAIRAEVLAAADPLAQ